MSISISKQPRLSRDQRRKLLTGLLFISPWLLGFSLFTIYPLGASLYYSFTRYDLLRPAVFIGLENYTQLFTEDPTFRVVLYNTLYYVMLSAPLGVVTAFLMASLLNTRILGRSVFRAIFFFPTIVPTVVTAFVWQFLLNAQFGPINSVLQSSGLATIPFLTSPALSKPSLILIHLWGQGGAIVIFLATLQDVPRTLYEAAIVDGANAWQKFWHITIPMCTPVILFQLIMSFVWGFQSFLMPYLILNGGPNQSTELYSVYLFRNAFSYLRMGKASALAWILFAIIVTFTIILFRTSARWVYYGGEEQ